MSATEIADKHMINTQTQMIHGSSRSLTNKYGKEICMETTSNHLYDLQNGFSDPKLYTRVCFESNLNLARL